MATPSPNKELIRDILQWDTASWHKALAYWEQAIDWSNVQNCLELGGREGGLSLWLAMKNKTVVCSDLQDVKRTAEPLHLKHGVSHLITYQDIDATSIPYENQFDIIVFKSIIGGIGRKDNPGIQQQVFRQIHKALKPGGHLLFAENLVASPLHRMLRRRFNNWQHYWQYVSVNDLKNYLAPFSSFELNTNGFLATLGRSEQQKRLLAGLDKVFFNHLVPQQWKYIAYGVARK